jgi:hypothetical protein
VRRTGEPGEARPIVARIAYPVNWIDAYGSVPIFADQFTTRGQMSG